MANGQALFHHLRSIPKPYNDAPVGVYRDSFYQHVQSDGVRGGYSFGQLFQLAEEAVQSGATAVPFLNFLRQCLISLLQRLIARGELLHFLLVLRLILRDGRVRADGAVQLFRLRRELPLYLLQRVLQR